MRLDGVDPNKPPELVENVFRRAQETFGRMITPALVMAHRPEILLASARLNQAVGTSKVVEPRMKTLVSLRTAQIIGCPF